MSIHSHDDAGARICVSGAFLGAQHTRNERRIWTVVAVTAAMMVGEIVGGTLFGSIALVADGWHMCSHAATLTVAAMAYRFARIYEHDPRFAFGTGKVGELAGFGSAVVLGVIALLIGWESFSRFFNPRVIHFEQAVAVAALGLLVNLVSAWLLHAGEGGGHGHDHSHSHDHDHGHARRAGGKAVDARHRDNNLRAAYMHVVADALTSVLAIAGLLAAWFLGWTWMDPVIGVVGGVLIAHWSVGLMRSAGASLLDVADNSIAVSAIRGRLETDGDRVSDLHLWRLAPGHQALVVTVVTPTPQPVEVYKDRLQGLPMLSHITVEVRAAPAAGV